MRMKPLSKRKNAPVVDLSSLQIQPFKHPIKGPSSGRGSMSATVTTSSEESRERYMSSSHSRHSSHAGSHRGSSRSRPRGRTASDTGGGQAARGRSSSRPREISLAINVSKREPRAPLDGIELSLPVRRGRSQSRPKELEIPIVVTSRSRSGGAVEKVNQPTENRPAERGAALYKRASMETMEEEKVYNSVHHSTFSFEKVASKNRRGRSASRGRLTTRENTVSSKGEAVSSSLRSHESSEKQSVARQNRHVSIPPRLSRETTSVEKQSQSQEESKRLIPAGHSHRARSQSISRKQLTTMDELLQKKEKSRLNRQYLRRQSISVSPPANRSKSPIRPKSSHYQRKQSVETSSSSYGDSQLSCSSSSAYDRFIQSRTISSSNKDAKQENKVSAIHKSRVSGVHEETTILRPQHNSENAFQTAFDKDGYCTVHPFIQLKLKLPSGTWRTLSQSCIMCRQMENAPNRENKSETALSRHHSTGTRSSAGRHETSNRTVLTSTSGFCSLTLSNLENEESPASIQVDSSTCKSFDDSVLSYSKSYLGHVRKSSQDSIPYHRSHAESKSFSPDEASDERKGSSSKAMKSESSHGQIHIFSGASSQASMSNSRNHSSNVSTSSKYSCAADLNLVKSTSSSSKQNEKAVENPNIDMSRVRSAISKIKSLEVLQLEKVKSPSSSSSSRSNPPPPPLLPKPKVVPNKIHSPPPPPMNTVIELAGKNRTQQRTPPPPPPPRPPANKAHTGTATNDDTLNSSNFDSMAVLSPEPQSGFQDEFPFENDYDMKEQNHYNVPTYDNYNIATPYNNAESVPYSMGYSHLNSNDHYAGELECCNNAPTSNLETPVSKEWMKYCTGHVDVDGNGNQPKEKKGKLFSRSKHTNNERETIKNVKQMPFTDNFGDSGLYTGQVNENGRPNGKGKMKYENGVFYEGSWTDGCQDEKAASQYDRIRGGFTSWQGQGSQATKSGMVLPWNARKSDAFDPNRKIHVRGMEWTDLNGDSGRFTGEVNSDNLPHGIGIMKYDYGLIAEGEWIKGVLREGPQDRMLGTASVVNGGRPIGPGMSVGPGVQGFSGAASVMGGGLSIGPGSIFGASHMYPSMPYGGGMNPMIMANQANQASQYAMIAQQNAMLKSSMGMMYAGGGSVYGGMSAYGMMPPIAMPMPHPQSGEQTPNKLPISEIKFN